MSAHLQTFERLSAPIVRIGGGAPLKAIAAAMTDAEQPLKAVQGSSRGAGAVARTHIPWRRARGC
jgi:hypothetical protein